MKSLMGGIALAVLVGTAFGQSNEDKYKEKLKKDFVSKIPWETSLEAAKAKAAAQKKLIFGYFTRSYAP